MEQIDNTHLSFYPCMYPTRRPLRIVRSRPTNAFQAQQEAQLLPASSCISVEADELHRKVTLLNT